MSVLDFRSDTVTRPTRAMLAAMATAPVGDDVYGGDPTVIALQERCAALLGKEAGLFVPSGSMGNLVALGALAGRGEEVLCDVDAHVLNQEGGGVALLGVVVRALPSEDGVVSARRLAAAIRRGDDHAPRTAVACLEITHTGLGGTVPDLGAVRAAAAACRERGVSVHLDGARLFNAQAATGTSVREWAACADTVTFCFTKGLGGPVGSMVVGPAEVIRHARLWRKRLGGAMRQAGLLAAAADVALTEGAPRLVEDHALARDLARRLADRYPGCVDPWSVQTNIVHVDTGPLGVPSRVLAGALADRGLLTKSYDDTYLRFVTHRDVGPADVRAAVAVLGEVTDALRRAA